MTSFINFIPSVFTLLNLLLGYLAMIYSFRGDFQLSAWLIACASVLDFLDGRIARLLKTSSKFGAELDSLSDIVSFGVAPSMLVYHFCHQSVSKPILSTFEFYDYVFVFLCFLPIMAGALRLARFNVTQALELKKKSDFVGMPIPSSALILSSFVIFSSNQTLLSPYIDIIFPILLVALSVLMISSFRYLMLPKLTFSTKEHRIKILALIFLFLLFLYQPTYMLFPIMMVYLFSGVALGVIDFIKPQQSI